VYRCDRELEVGERHMTTQPNDPSAPSDNPEAQKIALEYARLAQEREFKLRELDIQEYQAKRNQWSTPVITAVSAGILGLFGTVWNGCQGVAAEKRQQEGTLILEAIKTGTQEKQLAAANLLFMAKAGLISLTRDQLQRLEQEAGTANPLPNLPKPSQQVAFDPSPALTPEVQANIQATVTSFLQYLGSLGYQQRGEKFRVYVDPNLKDNVYYSIESERVHVPPELAVDPDAVLQQLTAAILVEVTGAWVVRGDDPKLYPLVMGLSDYFTCSHQDDPTLGEIFVAVVYKGQSDKPYLRKLENDRRFTEAVREPNSRGEIWGGAFWELRTRLGKQAADKIIFSAWTLVREDDVRNDHERFFLSKLIEADQRLNGGKNAARIRSVFYSRGFPVN
jgi:hypothetical protein